MNKRVNHRAFVCRECRHIERPDYVSESHACPDCGKDMSFVKSTSEGRVVFGFMGLDSYDEYLKTDLWKGIRKKVLVRDGRSCRCCGAKALTAHHTSYDFEVLMGRRNDDLVSICRPCHEQVHFDESGVKVTLDEANRRMRRIMSFRKPRNSIKPDRKCNPKKVEEPRQGSAVKNTVKAMVEPCCSSPVRKKKRKRGGGPFYAVYDGWQTGIFNNWG